MRLTTSFTDTEFKCRCCGSLGPGISKPLVEKLETLRTQLGVAIFIASGYRCPAHNKAVGGVSNSQHVLGKAADITVKGMAPGDVANAAEALFADGGIGRYAGFTHVDVRAGKSRWGLPPIRTATIPTIFIARPADVGGTQPDEFAEAVKWGKDEGLILGDPTSAVDRQSLAVILKRYHDKFSKGGE